MYTFQIKTEKLEETVINENLMFYPVMIYLICQSIKAPCAACVVFDGNENIIPKIEIIGGFDVFFKKYVHVCYQILNHCFTDEYAKVEDAVLISYLSEKQLAVCRNFKNEFYLGRIGTDKIMTIDVKNPPKELIAADFQKKLQVMCDCFKP